MKPRFQKRALVRTREREARMLRHLRDRHDRAWLVGAGGAIGHWKIVSGLWREQDGNLVCVVSGVARGPWRKAMPQEYFLFDSAAHDREPLRVYNEGKP
jgi:hypothetical protein